jgi:hypothetical protein
MIPTEPMLTFSSSLGFSAVTTGAGLAYGLDAESASSVLMGGAPE